MENHFISDSDKLKLKNKIIEPLQNSLKHFVYFFFKFLCLA